ncbi:hypothetical protein INT48_004357 [Thamnidium elegans]|uniref:Uncharacterized protein n=1 Tax=Thamnidium elegans TaxID=101142 RepID=A0A8H7SHX4_9FUNG|nr:hypothetical protein INT48_004357 [Thamnidium elegans]
MLAFSTQCWETLNGKQNMFEDGVCQQINQVNSSVGWRTLNTGDWIYYPQQTVNVSMTAATVSVALVGGCCAPSRYKESGFLFQDDGSTYSRTGNKIVAISDLPLMQNITVTGWYMKKFVDDHAMNLTIIPSIHHPDKQSIFFEIISFDRAMVIKHQYFDYQDKLIGNYSTGLLRNKLMIPDVTVPRYTRRILIQFYGSRADPMCFSYIYAGLYVYAPLSTLAQVCSQVATLLQYLSLANFIVIPIIFGIIPIKFLCRTPSHKVLMCIIIMLGSFILNQAWNLINSQSSIFHEWLPRAAKIVAFTTCTLFGLRLALDLPSYGITFARNLSFLVINLLAAVPTLIAYSIVLVFFVTRFITFQSCFMCNIEFLEVQDIEETYVKELIKLKKKDDQDEISWYNIMKISLLSLKDPATLKKHYRTLFGLHQHIRVPFAIKTSLTLLLYCIGQLIPLLLTQLIGVGGVIPVHICSWSPYLSQFQFHPEPMGFAIKTFFLMQIAVYIATLGAGGLCMIYSLGIIRRFTKDILRLRKGDYFLFKGKKNNGIDLDDAIRFLGVVIGFGFTGTLYFMVEISLIGTFITMLIQMDRFREALFHRVGYGVFFASFFIAFIVQLLQKIITNLIFVESRTRFSIQHRAPFLHYWYFMMLTSMTRALTSYIIRTLKLILRYPLFSVRVDRNAETWSVRRGDGGFTAYCGMLLAEHEYNNPIVLTFVECILSEKLAALPAGKLCRLHSKKFMKDLETNARFEDEKLNNSNNTFLKSDLKTDIYTSDMKEDDVKETILETVSKSNFNIATTNNKMNDSNETIIECASNKKTDKSKTYTKDLNASRRARTRWFLAYTLIHNPGFRQYRVY